LISVEDRILFQKWSKEIDSFTSGVSVPHSPPLAEHTETDILVTFINIIIILPFEHQFKLTF